MLVSLLALHPLRFRLPVSSKLVILALCLLCTSQPLRCAAQDIVPDEVLVGIRAENDDAGTSDRLAVVGQAVQRIGPIHAYRLKLPNNISVAQAIATLILRDDVVYAEPNHVVHHALASTATPNDTYFSQPYLSGYPAQYGPHRIQADLAWNIWHPRRAVTIAVLDSGIDYNHPDLINMFDRDISGNIIGYVTQDANQNQQTSDAHDVNGHGTHVAGIAAAEANNGTGIAGIAGWNGIAGLPARLSGIALAPFQPTSSAIRLLPVRVYTTFPPPVILAPLTEQICTWQKASTTPPDERKLST